MTASPDRIVHTEVMQLRATPAQVRDFILTPERILDYYPDPVEGGVLEPGRAIFCRGNMGASMLERVDAESSDDLLVIKVTTAIGLEAPYTRERIEAGNTFTMIEDWLLEATGSGTRLTKTWRDVTPNGEAPFPIEDAVREGAIHETAALIEGWNKAAERAEG